VAARNEDINLLVKVIINNMDYLDNEKREKVEDAIKRFNVPKRQQP
jgi:hypothetical protein